MPNLMTNHVLFAESLLLVAMPFAPSSFMLPGVRPGAPSSVLAPSSDALCSKPNDGATKWTPQTQEVWILPTRHITHSTHLPERPRFFAPLCSAPQNPFLPGRRPRWTHPTGGFFPILFLLRS